MMVCTCPPDTYSPDGYAIFTPTEGCPVHDQREPCGCSWHDDKCRHRDNELDHPRRRRGKPEA
jgi:hypothetical protein